MSKENVKKFLAELEKNPELKAKYLESIKEYQKESDKIMADKLLLLGKSSGFNFTESDLHETRTEFLDELNSNREISDSDLENVVGGFDFVYWAAKRGVHRPPPRTR